MTKPEFDFLECGEAARRLGISQQSVRVLVGAGKLQLAGRTFRGLLLFDETEVERVRLERASRHVSLPVPA